MGTKKETAAVEACEQMLIRIKGNPVLGYIFGDRFGRGCDELCAYINARREEAGKETLDQKTLVGGLRRELNTRPHGLVLDAWDMCKSKLDGSDDSLSDDEKVCRLREIATDAINAVRELAAAGNGEADSLIKELREFVR